MMCRLKSLKKHRPSLACLAVGSGLAMLSALPVQAAPLAGQVISNMAVGEYTEEGSTVVQVSRSNLVQTTIIPVYALNLTAANARSVVAGQHIYFPHTLSNTGNFTDSYNLLASNNVGDNFDYNNLAVYLDVDRDGIPDGDAVSTYSLTAGQSVGLLVGAIVPSGVTVGQLGRVSMSATSQNGAGVLSNIDTGTVTDQATLVVRKKFNSRQAATGDAVTVRIDYNNPTANALGEVVLTDTLDSNQLMYLAGGENWSGVAVNPATGANDPVGIDYSVTANEVTAVISSVPANGSGYVEFQVTVAQSDAGQIPNTVNVSYDHDANGATAPLSEVSNTAALMVSTEYGVEINGVSTSASSAAVDNLVTAAPVATGGEISFDNYVWNTGNAADRFNLSVTNDAFPAPHQIEFYRADGVTPLLDTNADGIPDTGELQPDEKIHIVVKVRYPSTHADTAATDYSVFPQAQSIADNSQVDTVEDRGSLIVTSAARLVDLVNKPEAASNGTGNGNVDNAGAAWKTLSVDSSVANTAGNTVTFPLQVSHTGTGATYLLSADADGDFNQLDLPAGVNAVRFYQSTGADCSVLGAEIGKTRYLNNGESQLYCAVVEVDKVNSSSTQPIYFRVSSSSYVSSNNASNPSMDTIKNAITINSVNTVPQVELMPNLRGQVAPQGSIVYSHMLTNHGDSALSGGHDFVLSDSQPGFSSTLYFDANNDGELDGSDPVVSSVSDLPGGQLASLDKVRLFVKVEASASSIGVTNITRVELENSTSSVLVADIVDMTTINSSQLRLSKLQAKDDNCDGTADGGLASYTQNNLMIGEQPSGQGQCVLYRVVLSNEGATTINSAFNFRDHTPAHTVMAVAPSCAPAACVSTSSPAIGQAGAVSGAISSVASGQSYEFSFGVRYVGQ